MLSRRLGIIAVFAVVALTAGCADKPLTDAERAALTPQAKVFELQGEFNILLRQVVTYASQPFCTATVTTACADREVVGDLQNYAEKAKLALDAAKSATSSTVAAAAAGLRVAIAQLSQRLIAKGVN